MRVRLELRVAGSPQCLYRMADYPAVPRAGDEVELCPDEGSTEVVAVQRVWWSDGDAPTLRLAPLSLLSPESYLLATGWSTDWPA